VVDRVKAACETEWDAHKSDCSAFVHAVGGKLGVTIAGQANEIVGTIRGGGPWRRLTDGVEAANRAQAGKLVLAGLRGDEQFEHSNHGHVAVVVSGPLAHGRYPSAYWGRLNGVGARFETINWAWPQHDRDRVTYAEHDLA